jgi:hypothetical protein
VEAGKQTGRRGAGNQQTESIAHNFGALAKKWGEKNWFQTACVQRIAVIH